MNEYYFQELKDSDYFPQPPAVLGFKPIRFDSYGSAVCRGIGWNHLGDATKAAEAWAEYAARKADLTEQHVGHICAVAARIVRICHVERKYSPFAVALAVEAFISTAIERAASQTVTAN